MRWNFWRSAAALFVLVGVLSGAVFGSESVRKQIEREVIEEASRELKLGPGDAKFAKRLARLEKEIVSLRTTRTEANAQLEKMVETLADIESRLVEVEMKKSATWIEIGLKHMRADAKLEDIRKLKWVVQIRDFENVGPAIVIVVDMGDAFDPAKKDNARGYLELLGEMIRNEIGRHAPTSKIAIAFVTAADRKRKLDHNIDWAVMVCTGEKFETFVALDGLKRLEKKPMQKRKWRIGDGMFRR